MPPLMSLTPPLHAAKVVEACDDDVGDSRFRYAATARHRIRRFRIAPILRLRLYANECRVVQTVVRAFELQDLFPSCRRAGDAAGMHGGFRPAGAEAHH